MSPPILLAPYSFARPGDTTTYAASDLIANSTTANLVVPLSWVTPFIPGSRVQIEGAILRKSTNGLTGADFRLELYNALPTFTSAGDNSSVATVVASGNAGWIGSLDLVGSTLVNAARDASGFGGLMRPITSHEPFVGRLAAGSKTIWGILQARGAYAPGDAEVFSTQLIARPA